MNFMTLSAAGEEEPAQARATTAGGTGW